MNSDDDEGGDNSKETSYELGDVIAQLQKDLLKNKKAFTAFEYNKRRAVYEYFIRLYDSHEKLKASKIAVGIVYINSGPYKSKRICFLVDNEDVTLKCKQLIRKESGLNDISSFQIKQYVDSAILPEHTGEIRKSISLRTAKRWLNVLGCQFNKYQKGPKIELIPPVLQVNERELILITHDECIFYSNDGKRGIWMYNGEKEEKTQPNVSAEARCYLIPAVFTFDNSMNHIAFADDAFIKVQKMVFEKDYLDLNIRGKPKGIKRMLEERGLLKKGLNLDCPKCKKKENSGQIDCCLKKIMASQPDFVIQKSTIVGLIKGVAKKYARDYCNYTWTSLQETVLRALDSVDVITIRKFAQKS
ncbi:6245_t:CDS:2, partial [Cetraspora pellucida]